MKLAAKVTKSQCTSVGSSTNIIMELCSTKTCSLGQPAHPDQVVYPSKSHLLAFGPYPSQPFPPLFLSKYL